MADPRSLTYRPQNLTSTGRDTVAQPHVNANDNDRSVAMEQSASSSSISSSASSLLTISSSTSLQSSSYLPVTPKHTFHPFDPVYSQNIYENMGISENNVPALPGPPMAKKALGVSELISPPEAEHLDSFDANNSVNKSCQSVVEAQIQIHNPDNTAKDPIRNPFSPPISPMGQKVDSAVQGNQDPILYPAASDTAASPLQSRPLFPDAEVGNRIAPQTPALFELVPAPRHNGQRPAVYMVSNIMHFYQADPRGWLKMQREQLKKDNKLRRAAQRAMSLQPQPSASKSDSSLPTRRNSAPRAPREQPASQLSQKASSHREQMALLQPVQNADNRVTKRAIRAPTTSRGNRPTHIAPQLNGTPRHVSSSSQGTKRIPGSSPEPRVRTSAPNREDKDFMALDDYCPPLSTLPERTNNLKVDWKGTPLDLSRDPFLHLLHRDEVGLAASLRLDCATYLTSKRRVFIRRLECARTPKEFRKTDAQQACKIDVNKASKLWTAYEKVGWLKLEHMHRFI